MRARVTLAYPLDTRRHHPGSAHQCVVSLVAPTSSARRDLMVAPMTGEDLCVSVSPIMKLDIGPRRCRDKANHKGVHWAYTSDGSSVDPRFDYTIGWDNEGKFRRA